MSFRTRATIAALFVFAVVSAARAQAPVQTSAQATAPPPDNDFYSLREPAAAGDAQAQFALANHYYRGLGVPQDYTQALPRLCSGLRSRRTRALLRLKINWATCINISLACRGITSVP